MAKVKTQKTIQENDAEVTEDIVIEEIVAVSEGPKVEIVVRDKEWRIANGIQE